MRFDGKVALVTGAAGVIGSCVSRRLLSEGCRVALVDYDRDALDGVMRSLDAGDRARAVTADVTSPESTRSCVAQAVGHFGPIDIFLNNAGIEGATAPITEYPDEIFNRVMAVNVTGVFLGMKYVVPAMRDGSSVVITSSVAGLGGSPSFVGYVASKHAVIGIAKCAALDLAPRGIRVNTVHPGMVESRMIERIEAAIDAGAPGGGARAAFRDRIPLGRYVTPEEVADAMLFLAGDDSRMMTGSQLVVDGGFLV